jgi:hypothetical protein
MREAVEKMERWIGAAWGEVSRGRRRGTRGKN